MSEEEVYIPVDGMRELCLSAVKLCVKDIRESPNYMGLKRYSAEQFLCGAWGGEFRGICVSLLGEDVFRQCNPPAKRRGRGDLKAELQKVCGLTGCSMNEASWYWYRYLLPLRSDGGTDTAWTESDIRDFIRHREKRKKRGRK